MSADLMAAAAAVTAFTTAYGERTPAEQGVDKAELEMSCSEMAACLRQVFDLLDQLGFQLQDHYAGMHSIASGRL